MKKTGRHGKYGKMAKKYFLWLVWWLEWVSSTFPVLHYLLHKKLLVFPFINFQLRFHNYKCFYANFNLTNVVTLVLPQHIVFVHCSYSSLSVHPSLILYKIRSPSLSPSHTYSSHLRVQPCDCLTFFSVRNFFFNLSSFSFIFPFFVALTIPLSGERTTSPF